MQIVAKGLSYTYNAKTKFPTTALKDINVTINDGEFVGIIGHTGSGKSTFIQHIDRLIEVQQGKFCVGEFNLSPKTRKEKKELKRNLIALRKKVGMVFQYPECQLFAETVFADVAYGIKKFMPNVSEQELITLVATALYRVGIDYEEFKDKSPFELSGGQKRRVAIAGVIATSPEVLVLDEPLAGLDPVGKRELMNLLKELKGNVCKTIIMISHDMDEVAENCERVIVFDQGTIAYDGSVKEVFSKVDELQSLRLDCPVTAKLTKTLAENGVMLENNLTMEDFISSVVKAVANE